MALARDLHCVALRLCRLHPSSSSLGRFFARSRARQFRKLLESSNTRTLQSMAGIFARLLLVGID